MVEKSGKTALIVGGGNGIGYATAVLLARTGVQVVAADADTRGLDRARAEIHSEGLSVELRHIDATNGDQCEMLVRDIVHRYSRIDYLVNSAGIIRRKSVIDTSESEWSLIMDVNVKTVFLMCKYVLPHMIGQGSGSIVNVGSGWGMVGGAAATAYCASKGAVALMTRAMAIDFGRHGVRINCVCPGDTDTNLLRSEAWQLDLPEEVLLAASAERPLGRIGKPAEIAEVIEFLLSSRSSFMTGSIVPVDGGGVA